jgi:hypothetical protein
MSTPSARYTRASELGEHAYCRRAWWLRQVRGIPSDNVAALAAGVAAHDAYGRSVRRPAALRRWALVLLVVGLTLLALGLVR